MERRWWRKRWVKVIAITVAVLGLLALGASRFIGGIFRAKVVALAREKLHSELSIGTVFYLPPFTFIARDVRLTRRGAEAEAAELMSARKVRVTLGGFPHGGEPPKVKSVTMEGAALRPPMGTFPLARLDLGVHSTSKGVYACTLTIDDGAAASGRADATLDVNARVCTVQRIAAHGNIGRFLDGLPLSTIARARLDEVAPDGTLSVAGSGQVPLAEPMRASYQLAIDLTDGKAKWKDVRRSFTGGKGQITIHNGPAETGSPVEAQLRRFEIAAGTAQITFGGGKLTVWPQRKRWKVADVVGSVRMGRELPLGLERSGWFFEQAEFRGPAEFTVAASGPTKLPPGGNPLESIDHQVLVYPHGISLKPSTFPEPIRDVVGGPIAFRGGVVTFQNLSGQCGRDKLLLRGARLTLWDRARKIDLEDLRTQVKFEEIAGTVIFQRPVTRYPGPVGKTIAALRPAGPFAVGGGSWYAMNRPAKDDPGRKLKPDFFIRLIGDGGSFVVTEYNVPLNEIHGESTIGPLRVDIGHFEAKSLGGRAIAAGWITPGRPLLFEGQAQVREIDLRQLADLLDLREPARSRLSGVGYCTAQITGSGKGGKHTPAQTFTADGEAQVLHGDFWTVPPVGVVATQVKREDQLGIGDAAAVFHIADEMITLKSAAVNAPLIGLQGQGTVGFDKSLDLTVVAAPLGDWRDQMRRAKIPVVDDVLGAVQQLLNTVQGVLFYQFRVTGTLEHPIKTLIPAPVLTQPVAMLFGQMVRQDSNGQLLQDVRANAGAATKPSGKGKK